MLDGIGDVHRRAVDPGFIQCGVEQLPSGPHERTPDKVFLVARLLADQHHARVHRAFAEDRLGRRLPERAVATLRGDGADVGQRRTRRNAVDRGLRSRQPVGPRQRLGIDRQPRARRRIDTRVAVGLRGGTFDHAWPARNRPRVVDHLLRALPRRGNQRRDQLGLGQVAPVLRRHLGAHRRDLESRRIEDACVVRAPERFELVVVGRFGARGAQCQLEMRAIPVDARLGRKDRPAPVGEAAREERRGRLDDVMRRLEPRDVQRSACVDLAKAHERLHLVHVMANTLRHRIRARHVGVDGNAQQRPLVAEAPEQPVEQGEALGIAMEDCRRTEHDECLRHREPRCFARSRACGGITTRSREDSTQFRADGPLDHLRGYLSREQVARGGAPTGEISHARERHVLHAPPRP